jgi:hypothetical protein
MVKAVEEFAETNEMDMWVGYLHHEITIEARVEYEGKLYAQRAILDLSDCGNTKLGDVALVESKCQALMRELIKIVTEATCTPHS